MRRVQRAQPWSAGARKTSPWPSSPCTKATGPAIWHGQRLVDTSRNRDVAATTDLQQFQGVGCGNGDIGIAEDRRQPDDIELGGLERVEDRHGIVDARVGVDQYLPREGSTHRESRTWRTPATRLVIF